MAIQAAFATLLTNIEAAIQESLARHSAAVQKGDFDAVELEVERQRNLVSMRNQLQALRDMWREVVGEQSAPVATEPGKSGQTKTQPASPGSGESKADSSILEIDMGGLPIFAVYKSQRFEALLFPDHRVLLKGVEYSSPSGAATYLLETGRANGWIFWRYLDKRGRARPISELRKRKKIDSSTSPKRRTTKRLQRGMKTSEKKYFVPILNALAKMDGQGSTAQVLDHLEKQLATSFNEFDLSIRKDGQPRWRNTAQWARLKMVKEGLLVANSPRGIWKITDAGRVYLRDHSEN